ncbi:MAG: hypothetical protein K0Q50_1366 [Vampirovibrio sp.]|nr:hypothetical protein [Vampirovibrio sp.]
MLLWANGLIPLIVVWLPVKRLLFDSLFHYTHTAQSIPIAILIFIRSSSLNKDWIIMTHLSARLGYFQVNQPVFTGSTFQRNVPLSTTSLPKQKPADRFERSVHFASNSTLIKKTVGKMPDGTVVNLEETIDSSSDGQTQVRNGQFIFNDPANKRKDGKGYIDYEAVITPDHVDFQYIWNNSTKRGGIALASWHLTNGIHREKFIATDVKNEGLYDLAKKYGLKTDQKKKMIEAPFDTVKTLAKIKLLLAGWKLE